MGTMVAVLNKKGADATRAIVETLASIRRESDKCLGIASALSFLVEKDMEPLQAKIGLSCIALGSVFAENEQPFGSTENATFVFDGTLYSPVTEPKRLDAIANRLQRDGKEAVEKLIKNTEGDFSIVVAEKGRIVAGRDPMGVQPLYYGENETSAALGSNRKVLRKLGIEDTRSFPPGHVGFVSPDGFKFKPVKTISPARPRQTTMQRATTALAKMLEESVRLRLKDLKEVAVAFSGGLDSSIIAFLAGKSHCKIHLVHVSLAGQPEIEEAEEAAGELRLPLSVFLFGEEDVVKILTKVVELIEEPDPVKVAIGIPVFVTAENVAKEGFKVLLAGQGADELFGGYQRYVKEYLLNGEGKVRKTMFNDISRLHENNIERDRKICSYNNVELRLPFASYKIANLAVSLPVCLKIDRKHESLRKLALREMAEKLGMPLSIVTKPKKAMQYTTGTSSALRKLAKKQKLSVDEYVNRLYLSSIAEK